MEYGRVVSELWRDVGGGDAECAMHIAEKEFQDNHEPPA